MLIPGSGKLYAAVGLAAVLAAGSLWLYNRGWRAGYAAHVAEVAETTADLRDRLDAAEDKVRAMEAERLAAERILDTLQDELTDAITASPGADGPGIPPELLRRLDAIR